jgi:hypothetical protein
LNLFRKQRNWSDIVSDPHAPYMIGRLLGANEMAVVLLRLEDNKTAQQVAEALSAIGGYFFTDGFMGGVKVKSVGISEKPSSEQPTRANPKVN